MENIDSLIREMKEETGVLKSENIEEAFRKTDRADFVPLDYKENTYLDRPLYIGAGQTISQPSTVVFMLELLEPKEGEKILDVGAGSGWTTALLSEIVGSEGEVFGIEKIPSLVKFGNKNLKEQGTKNTTIEIEEAQSVLGKPEEAPFDKILVSASSEEPPKELVEQLKENGVMVIPVRESIFKVKKDKEGDISKEEHRGFVFVPLKNKRDE